MSTGPSPPSSKRPTRRSFLSGVAAAVLGSRSEPQIHAKGQIMQGTRISREGLRRLHETMASYVAADVRVCDVALP